MRKLGPSIAAACVAAAPVCTAPAAQAVDMLGDTLNFERLWPDLLSPSPDDFVPASTIVTAGSGDAVWWTERTVVDPGPNELAFLFPTPSSYDARAGIFDGYRIAGFSHDIQAVRLQQPHNGPLTITPRLGNGPRFVTVDLEGAYIAGEVFTLHVTFVPEPGTVALLLAGPGVVAIAAHRGAARRSG